MMHVRSLALAASLMLAACGGGHASSVTPPATIAASATATLVIPAVAPSSSATRRAQYVSPATMWVTFAVNGGTAQGFDASSTSPNCTTVPSGRSCSFTIVLGTVTPGVQAIAVKTYTANPVPGPATLLSENTATVTLAAGVANVALPLVLNGVAAAATFSVPSTLLTLGQAASVPVMVRVFDPQDYTIVGNAPFDNGGGVQLSVQYGTGSLTATPLNGTPVTAASVTVTSPSTTVVYNYNGGPALDANVYGTFVNPPSANVTLPGTVIPVRPVAANTVDVVGGQTPQGARPARGADGSVYAVTTTGIAKIGFDAVETPSAHVCTQAGAIDFTTQNNALGFILSSTGVASMPLTPFPAGACGAMTRATFNPSNTGQSIAADATGVVAVSEGPFGTPGSGSPLYLSAFNATTGANTLPENATIYSTSNATLYGDPVAQAYGLSTSANYGEDIVASTGTDASGVSTVSVPSTDGDVSNGTFAFGVDPNLQTLYLLDTSTSSDMSETTTTPAVRNLATNTDYPHLLGTVQPNAAVVVGLDGRVFVISGNTVASYDATSASFLFTTLTAPSSGVDITGAVVGADGRLWCVDGQNGHIFVFPGQGATL